MLSFPSIERIYCLMCLFCPVCFVDYFDIQSTYSSGALGPCTSTNILRTAYIQGKRHLSRRDNTGSYPHGTHRCNVHFVLHRSFARWEGLPCTLSRIATLILYVAPRNSLSRVFLGHGHETEVNFGLRRNMCLRRNVYRLGGGAIAADRSSSKFHEQ